MLDLISYTIVVTLELIGNTNILLYDIALTKNGALRKESREYLKEQYKLLQEHAQNNFICMSGGSYTLCNYH